jgi:hypothetical protein
MPITYRDLKKIYLAPISAKCQRILGDKIAEPYPQEMITKALSNSITNKDYTELIKRGCWSSIEYPGLLYLCDIYIHPLTQVEAYLKLADKLERLSK